MCYRRMAYGLAARRHRERGSPMPRRAHTPHCTGHPCRLQQGERLRPSRAAAARRPSGWCGGARPTRPAARAAPGARSNAREAVTAHPPRTPSAHPLRTGRVRERRGRGEGAGGGRPPPFHDVPAAADGAPDERCGVGRAAAPTLVSEPGSVYTPCLSSASGPESPMRPIPSTGRQDQAPSSA